MVKKGNRLFKMLIVLGDVLGITLSFYTTLFLRISLNPFFEIKFGFPDIHQHIFPLYVLLIVWIATFRQMELYKFSEQASFVNGIIGIIKGSTTSTIVLIFIVFLFQLDEYSRSLIFMFWGIAVVEISLIRVLVFRGLKWLKLRDVGVERVVIFGYNDEASRLGANINNTEGIGYKFLGYFLPEMSPPSHWAGNITFLDAQENVLRKSGKISEVIASLDLNRIIICDSTMTREQALYIAEICDEMGISLDRIPDLLGVISERISITEIANVPLINLRPKEVTRWDHIAKRVVDGIIVLAGGILILPLMVLIGILIKRDSPGPVFYVQQRVGKRGKNFPMYKFRSMYVDAEEQRRALARFNEVDGCLFKIKDDPRVTRIGKLLRRYSLDELPQIWNVLKGEMSLVGPRPLPVPDFEDGSSNSRYTYWIKQRTKVLPGITGLWQIQGRSDLPFEEMVKFDLYYIENWSLWLDLQILIKTLPVVLRGIGAY